MKKLLILIFLSLALTVTVACGSKTSSLLPEGDDGITSTPPQYQTIIESMDYSKSSLTKVQVAITGGTERSYFVETLNDDGDYAVTVKDGKTESFSKNGSFITVKNYLLEEYERGGFDGYAKHLVFTPINSLLNLNGQTVRSVSAFFGDDNVTVYKIYLFEGLVQQALPILDKEFPYLEDVKDLSLEISVGGTLSKIKVEIKALYKDGSTDSAITVTVDYQEIVRVVE